MKPEFYNAPRPRREIRAVYDDTTVRVYQAFGPNIALPALEAQTFVNPFSFVISWASWIKPSFLWTMARTGWGRYTRIGNKNARPEHEGEAYILAVDVTREYFDHILSIARMTHYSKEYSKAEWKKYMRTAEAYVQWDPEKTIYGQKRTWKSIQIGLKTPVLRDYATSIQMITNMSDIIQEICETSGTENKIALLPDELPYPVSDTTLINLGMNLE